MEVNHREGTRRRSRDGLGAREARLDDADDALGAADDDAKKQYTQGKLDEKIVKKKCKIKITQHKLETLQMMKQWLEK